MTRSTTRTHNAALAEKLLASGGRLRRLAHDMVVDLGAASISTQKVVEGVSITPCRQTRKRSPPPLAWRHRPDMLTTRFGREWIALGTGSSCWPAPGRAARYSLSHREVIRDTRGRIIGAIVVAAMPASAWWSGDPWIPEIFVVPEFQGRGLGGVLIAEAVYECREAGHERLGFSVTEGNPAQLLYEHFGFRVFRLRGSSRAERGKSRQRVLGPVMSADEARGSSRGLGTRSLTT